MSAESMWCEWDGSDPLNRGADAGGVAAVAELVSALLDRQPNNATLEFLRHWLAEPRWEHAPELALYPVAILRDRIARMLADRSPAAAELLAYYASRGDLLDNAPDDASAIT